MRTYSFLIVGESDFFLAQREGLIPNGALTAVKEDRISLVSLLRLISSFEDYSNRDVFPRYSYGELGLLRHKLCSLLFLQKPLFCDFGLHWDTFIMGFIAGVIVVLLVLAVSFGLILDRLMALYKTSWLLRTFLRPYMG